MKPYTPAQLGTMDIESIVYIPGPPTYVAIKLGDYRWALSGKALILSDHDLAELKPVALYTTSVAFDVVRVSYDEEISLGLFWSRSLAYQFIREEYSYQASVPYPLVQHESADLFALLPLALMERFMAITDETIDEEVQALSQLGTVTLFRVMERDVLDA